MKEVSQDEFEELIKRVLEGEISLKKVVEELQTTYSAVNNRITSMRETNPELYAAYIEQRPYKPKRNSQIDSEALLTNIILEGLTLRQASVKYDIPLRTIDRRIVEVRKQNPTLYAIYTRYKEKEMTLEDEALLCANRGEVKSEQDAAEIKLDEIIKISKEYERLIADNNELTHYQVAEKLGYTPQQIDEMYKKVRRITTQKSFREGIRVDSSELNVHQTEIESKTSDETEKEK